jgi:hypothetical protein
LPTTLLMLCEVDFHDKPTITSVPGVFEVVSAQAVPDELVAVHEADSSAVYEIVAQAGDELSSARKTNSFLIES